MDFKEDYKGTSGSTSGKYFRGFFLELSFPMDSGRLSIGLEWSGVVSAEVKEEYMTLQG